MIYRERSRERRGKRDKYGRYYPASDTEDNIFYHNGIARKQNSFDSLTLSPASVDSRKSSVSAHRIFQIFSANEFNLDSWLLVKYLF